MLDYKSVKLENQIGSSIGVTSFLIRCLVAWRLSFFLRTDSQLSDLDWTTSKKIGDSSTRVNMISSLSLFFFCFSVYKTQTQNFI